MTIASEHDFVAVAQTEAKRLSATGESTVITREACVAGGIVPFDPSKAIALIWRGFPPDVFQVSYDGLTKNFLVEEWKVRPLPLPIEFDEQAVSAGGDSTMAEGDRMG